MILHWVINLKPGNPQMQHRFQLLCKSPNPGPQSEMTSAIWKIPSPPPNPPAINPEVPKGKWIANWKYSAKKWYPFLARKESSRLTNDIYKNACSELGSCACDFLLGLLKCIFSVFECKSLQLLSIVNIQVARTKGGLEGLSLCHRVLVQACRSRRARGQHPASAFAITAAPHRQLLAWAEAAQAGHRTTLRWTGQQHSDPLSSLFTWPGQHFPSLDFSPS